MHKCTLQPHDLKHVFDQVGKLLLLPLNLRTSALIEQVGSHVACQAMAPNTEQKPPTGNGLSRNRYGAPNFGKKKYRI